MKYDEPQEERLAKHRAIVAMLELSRKIASQNSQLAIDANKALESLFYIEGRLNNFYFKYGVDTHKNTISLKSTKDEIEITTKPGLSMKIEEVKLNNTIHSINQVFNRDLQNTFQKLEDLLTGDGWKHTEEKGLLVSKLEKGELPELDGLDEREQTTVTTLYRGYRALVRLRKYIQEEVPEFFEIVKTYFNDGYLPNDGTAPIFKTSEEVFEEFDLS
ncbi:hypothetical protein KY346_03870 [Candidatus Woesearchaeota archaeon]|nr:hypothetical protein [Candidatus Woesearchaeota archaeon]